MGDIAKSRDKIQGDLRDLVDDTKELLQATANVADKQAKAARDRVEASLQRVQERAVEGANYVRGKAEEQLHVVDQRVRSNPYEAAGISFGIGLVLGFLVSRK